MASLLINLMSIGKKFKNDFLEQKIMVSIATITLEVKYKVKTWEIDKLYFENMDNKKRVGIKYEITERNA